MNSVCFVSATDGWAVGDGGAILHTVTGGLPDTKPPVTSQQGADDLWHNSDRTVTFSAADPDAPNSSGVAYTEYAIDGGPWTEGTELTVPAAADHSNDGVHTILFRSRDCVGNLESIAELPGEDRHDSAGHHAQHPVGGRHLRQGSGRAGRLVGERRPLRR